MRVDAPQASWTASASRILFGMFFVSGVCGLMYEVVWVRMLTRILGSTSYATSTVLAVFMGGLALGSFLSGRFVDRVRRPLLWYAMLELAVAAAALMTLILPQQLLPLYRTLYHAADGSRTILTTWQVCISTVVLLLPTLLMGATLPTLCSFGGRWFPDFRRGVANLYAVNTFGAFVGCLTAGFVLLGTIGETATIVCGAMLNAIVAMVAVGLSRKYESATRIERIKVAEEPSVQQPTDRKLRWAILLAFAINGFIALATEVIWGRMLVLYQGTSIYAFSSMLGVVLAGIGLGSYWMGRSLDELTNPLRTYARVQILSAVAALFALHLFGWMGGMARPSFLTGTNLRVLLTAPILLLGPLSFLWGMGFPLAAHCYTRVAGRAGRDVSDLYAWNTFGSILGALAGGFLFISTFGVSRSGIVLAIASALVGGWLLKLDARRQVLGQSTPSKSKHVSWGLLVACCVLAVTVGDPYLRVIESRMQARMATKSADSLQVFRHTESATGTTTAFGPYKQLWVNGEGMTHLCVETKLMAHLPLALADDPQATPDQPARDRRVCVICCGMGTSLKSAMVYDDVESWVVELLPDVFDCFGFFHPDQKDLLRRPDVHAIADDGRNYLQMNDRRYDVITVDPAPPFYSAGTVNLYTQEFFELAKSRITDGGVFCLWIPPWEEHEIRYVMKTYLNVFEHTRIWSGPGSDGFPQGFYMLGRRQPFKDVDQRITEMYRDANVVRDLQEWDDIVDSAAELQALYLGDGNEVRKLLTNVPVMTDDTPVTEFPLFRSLFVQKPNIFTGDVLRRQIAGIRKAPVRKEPKRNRIASSQR
ncbi:fused MFS/spermidine synthase [Thalassoroseus pseudoceratinae]|uniref:fused MFS/spermidine synthase n=1 Tax=Thalassoroseus pseudoceratinae TaxID=2713176 RepID=UPI00141F7E11|nr:fused MFS/spermidine synthase [Thalassoroseus pseudoceratinae]